jgi:hypothetical protein
MCATIPTHGRSWETRSRCSGCGTRNYLSTKRATFVILGTITWRSKCVVMAQRSNRLSAKCYWRCGEVAVSLLIEFESSDRLLGASLRIEAVLQSHSLSLFLTYTSLSRVCLSRFLALWSSVLSISRSSSLFLILLYHSVTHDSAAINLYTYLGETAIFDRRKRFPPLHNLQRWELPQNQAVSTELGAAPNCSQTRERGSRPSPFFHYWRACPCSAMFIGYIASPSC